MLSFNLDRVAKSPGETFSEAENEKCYFRFPYESMTYDVCHRFGRPTRGALMTSREVINLESDCFLQEDNNGSWIRSGFQPGFNYAP